jgi:hypothetical protein
MRSAGTGGTIGISFGGVGAGAIDGRSVGGGVVLDGRSGCGVSTGAFRLAAGFC